MTINKARTAENEIEYSLPRGGISDAGYLRLKHSDLTGRYCTDIIIVRPAFRRQGIGTALLSHAAADLGYTPEPEAILDNKTAPAFWQKHGFQTGFNQQVLEG